MIGKPASPPFALIDGSYRYTYEYVPDPSGLSAVVHAVEALRCGFVDLLVAGGTESMSNAPYVLKEARWGYRMGNGEVIDSMIAEGLTCAIGRW